MHLTKAHPNIIRLIDAFETDDLILMVLERAEGKDLQSIMDSRASPQFSEAVTRVIFEQVGGLAGLLDGTALGQVHTLQCRRYCVLHVRRWLCCM